ncbi:MAG: hypothetical protein ACFE9L_13770 [Candidatus Hodarchaeota archaeon]
MALAKPKPALPLYRAMDIGPELRSKTLPENIEIPPGITPEETSGGGGASLQQTGYYEPGDIMWWATYDIYEPWYGMLLTWFELRVVGTVAEIWVQVDLSYPDGSADVVSDERAQYILDEYESNIYPINTAYFGTPCPHEGTDDLWGSGAWYEETGRDVILISNVRDTMYYDPLYPYFVIGFYWRNFEILFDRNIITLDSLAWDIISGPPVYAYDATAAHELQHLIHDDYNPDDAVFINEGCSVFSEMLCGYGTPWGDIDSYLATPDNSLTEWDDQPYNDLADYGQAGLWAIYLTDRFGPSFLSNHVQSGLPGIDGLNYALFPRTFDQVYHDWRIANLIHSNKPGSGVYNYDSIDLSTTDPPRIYEITPADSPVVGSEFGNTITILGWDTGIANLGSYGTDYIRISGFEDEEDVLFSFDGDD